MADINACKGIIFDLDETLLNTLEVYWVAFNRGIGDFGLKPLEKQEIARFLDSGMRLGDMLTTVSPELFAEQEKRVACQESIRKWYLEIGTLKVKLKPGVKRLLQLLKKGGYKIGIVTGRMTRGENKWTELKRLGIDEYIQCQFTAVEAPPKPAPDGLLKCANEMGLSPAACLFIGDSRIDIAAGKNAGMKTAAISSGVAQKENIQALKPDYIFTDLESFRLFLSGSLTGNRRKKPATLKFQGVAVQGLGESSCFSCLPWIKAQFISKFGIDPYPGTFNLKIQDPSALKNVRRLKARKGVEIVPSEPGFCPAKGFLVRLNGAVEGALIIPLVPRYPDNKVEIIAAVNIREVLSIKDGDLVNIEIRLE